METNDQLFCPASNDTITYVKHEESNSNHLIMIFTAAFLTNLMFSSLFKLTKWLFKVDNSTSVEINTGDDKNNPQDVPNIKYFNLHKAFSCPGKIRNDDQKLPIDEDLRGLLSYRDSTQESVCEYRYGGYRPTFVNENLGDNYTVIRKLGYGHFSTVWLCKDNRKDEKYVAVKIVKAMEMCDSMAREEIKVLDKLANIELDHPGKKFIIHMLDHFQVQSSNGIHMCIAFELMGPSLLHLIVQSKYQGIYKAAVRSIIRQILIGLIYLHNKCKIIHTDLKPENILIKVNDAYIQTMIEKTRYYNEKSLPMPASYVTSETFESQLENDPEIFSNPGSDNVGTETGTERVIRSSSFPRLVDVIPSDSELSVRRITSKQELYVSPHIEVVIADLGNACWDNDKIAGTIQTKQYRALEVLLGADYDCPADIWSVGCIAFELATGEFLFNPRRTISYSSVEDHILLIYELLGGIPTYIASRGSKSHKFFNNMGELTICPVEDLHFWGTEDVLVQKYEWKRVDAIPFASLITSMIEPDPELRVNARSALTHQWIMDSS